MINKTSCLRKKGTGRPKKNFQLHFKISYFNLILKKFSSLSPRRAALALNLDIKWGATKYHPAGRNWPAGRVFETPVI